MCITFCFHHSVLAVLPSSSESLDVKSSLCDQPALKLLSVYKRLDFLYKLLLYENVYKDKELLGKLGLSHALSSMQQA